ncbi:MAG: hypothetical protein IKS99_00445 [Firmicutes bacterium]|nr:hypothetical protein [Bacillota bacterium]
MKKFICVILCLTLIFASATAAFGATSYASYKITKTNKMVIMYVSYATAEFNDGMGGVMEAVPEKDTDVYTLYDVVIWSDRICLYKFKGNIQESAAKYISKHYDSSDKDFNYEKAWRAYRNSCCLKTVKVKSYEGQPSKNSSARLKAYKSFFNIIKKKSPSKHVAIKYSGHGGGKTFCCSLSEKDTKTLLKYGVKTFGQKFAFIDYGTNCQSGCTDILDYYADYTDYMLVNQLDFGGWQWDKWDSAAYDKVDTEAVYHKMFVKGEKTVDAVKRMGKQHTKNWPYGKKNMKKNKIAQSVTVVKMKSYKTLMTALKKKNISYRKDLKTAIKKYNSSSLLDKYNNAVIYYARNKKQLGTWKSSYGYGLWYTS